MKISLFLLLLGLTTFSQAQEQTKTYTGKVGQIKDYNNTSYSKLVFDSASGYFADGNKVIVNKTLEFKGTGFNWNGGQQSSSFIFTGAVLGSGNFTKTGNNSAGLDFIFNGDLSAYTGNMDIMGAFTLSGVNDDLGSSRVGILQFGQGGMATGNLNQVTGTGSITSSGVIRYNYSNSATVANLISTQYLELRGIGSTSGTLTFTKLVQSDTTEQNNKTLILTQGQKAVFQAQVKNFDFVTLTGNSSATFNDVVTMGKEDNSTLSIEYGSAATLNKASLLKKVNVSGTLHLNASFSGLESGSLGGNGRINLGSFNATAATVKTSDLNSSFSGTLHLAGGKLIKSSSESSHILWNQGTLSSAGLNEGGTRGGLIDSSFQLGRGGTLLFNLDSTGTQDIGSFVINGLFSLQSSSDDGDLKKMTFGFNLTNPTHLEAGNYLLLSSTGFQGLVFGGKTADGRLLDANALNIDSSKLSVEGLTRTSTSRTVKDIFRGTGSNGFAVGQLFLSISETNLGLTWTGTGSNIWKVSRDGDGTNAWSDAGAGTHSFYNADNIVFDDSGVNKNIVIEGLVDPVAMLVNNSMGHDYTFSSQDSASGITGTQTKITKQGTGTLTLASENFHGGGLDLQGGRVVAKAQNALGSGALLLGASTSLEIQTSQATDHFILSNVRTGSGTLEKTGAGSLTLRGDSSRTGATLVKEGDLYLESISSGGTGDLNISAGATVHHNTGEEEHHMSNALLGKGAFHKEGTGTLRLHSSNDLFEGTFEVENGLFIAESNHSIGKAALNIGAQGMVVLAGNENLASSAKNHYNDGALIIHGKEDDSLVTLSNNISGNTGKILLIKGTLDGSHSNLGNQSEVEIQGGKIQNVTRSHATSPKATQLNLTPNDALTITTFDNVQDDNIVIKNWGDKNCIHLTNGTKITLSTDSASPASIQVNQSQVVDWATPESVAVGKVQLDASSEISFSGSLTLDLSSLEWNSEALDELNRTGRQRLAFKLVDLTAGGKILYDSNFEVLLNTLAGDIHYELVGTESEIKDHLAKTGVIYVHATKDLIPEPSTTTLSLLALTGLLLKRKRSRQTH